MKRNGHNASCCEHVTETWIDGLSLKRHRDAEDGVVRLRKSIRQRAYLGLMGSQNADFGEGCVKLGAQDEPALNWSLVALYLVSLVRF